MHVFVKLTFFHLGLWLYCSFILASINKAQVTLVKKTKACSQKNGFISLNLIFILLSISWSLYLQRIIPRIECNQRHIITNQSGVTALEEILWLSLLFLTIKKLLILQ
jgi:hypothetical protein